MAAPVKNRSYVIPFSRFLLSLIFIVSGVSKLTDWNETVGMMAQRGLPMAPVLLGASIIIEILGGLGLFFGNHARLAATALALFLIPVTLAFHGFWNFTGPEQSLQAVMFLKNLAILGGLLQVVGHGAGAYSVDESREKRGEPLQKAA